MYEAYVLGILLLPAVGSIISFMIGRKSEYHRNIFNIIVNVILFAVVTALYQPVSNQTIKVFIPDIMGTGLYLKLDVFRYIFIWITAFLWLLATIYSTKYLIKYKNRNRYYAFFMLTLSSTIGIFLSEHLLNLFTFFEIMSLTSYILVIHDEDQYAHEAGRSYIGMAIAGGLVLLMGLFLLYDYTGTLMIGELTLRMDQIGSMKYIISTLIIIGFGVKASMVPLHVWLPKAHPAAPAPASAVLSAILLKTGVFGILIVVGIIMKDDRILSTAIFILGLINMLLGGVLAIFQRNIKRILAYSSMSQVGYILMGIGLMGFLGEHKAIAAYGTMYHIVNHAIYKGLLFLGAGIIYMVLHDLSINEIRGFGKHKPVLKALFLIGIFAVAGMPGFNGFASKTLLHEALLEARHIYHNGWFQAAEVIFTISSGLTTAYLLKIFVAVFMEKNQRYWGQYRNHIYKRVKVPLVILSGVIIYMGIRPGALIHVINGSLETFGVHESISIKFYTWHNIKAVFSSVAIGFLIYVLMVRKYLRKQVDGEILYINPSLQWFNIERNMYIPIIKHIFGFSSAILHIIDQSMINMVRGIMKSIKLVMKMEMKYIYHIRQKIRMQMNGLFGTEKSSTYSFDRLREDVNLEMYNVAAALSRLRSSLNSITYSIYIFATILVMVLLVLFT
ncbi:proton-conducting transporter membrane subunit [Petroclostridium sp. X23]|uniref:complex I subunit 5 family protein n=1 Tax=Petroclostridium sp. X23 TaxID=3045146 RepID=UPI0024ADB17F|nr:proton-conducting transporter membrane subunit [Petroclostridium sp. X23]WHH58779.1 proton-conducting transporter membrane subunit [Petroclostridium sp. X23]